MWITAGSTDPTLSVDYVDLPTYETPSHPVETDWQDKPKEDIPEPEKDAVLCNCYAYVDSVVDLPPSQVVRNNLEESGDVAVFYYPESGLYHYAIVLDSSLEYITVAETNYKHCKFTKRVIRTDYNYLIGFYNSGRA